MVESWLPIGFVLPDGAHCGRVIYGDNKWLIIETLGEGRALLAHEELFSKWVSSGLIGEFEMRPFVFGSKVLREVSCGPSQLISSIADYRSPNSKSEALAFAMAFRETRTIDPSTPLQDAIYVEKFSRLLPTYGITSKLDDDIILGCWLTGGAHVSVKSFRRLRNMLTWMDSEQLRDVVETAGFEVMEVMAFQSHDPSATEIRNCAERKEEVPLGKELIIDDWKVTPKPFELPGRPGLQNFFNEHVIDIIRNKDRYATLGVNFPSAIVLHGPPGCGKTFAVEKLVEYLGWPSFEIDASSVASPYIHETSKKIAEIFEKAIENAPSVLVIDEMEAFLANRGASGGSHYRVEEVAEFLRRIPEAVKNEVLIVAMTNRIEMIDSAVIRRGRFDHVIKVDYASTDEVLALLNKLLATIPHDKTINTTLLAKHLAGRPLSDVAFVVREGARLAARSGLQELGQKFLLAAMQTTPARIEDGPGERIGFVRGERP